MDDRAFHDEQMAAFRRFAQHLATLSAAPGGDGLASLAAAFAELAATPERVPDEAPALVARLLTTAPQVAGEFPRDLLWYLGGECLHFMPDDEIEQYARLDEQRREAALGNRPFSWNDARAALLKLQ